MSVIEYIRSDAFSPPYMLPKSEVERCYREFFRQHPEINNVVDIYAFYYIATNDIVNGSLHDPVCMSGLRLADISIAADVDVKFLRGLVRLATDAETNKLEKLI